MATAATETAEIRLYGAIGDEYGITDLQFAQQMDELRDAEVVDLRINSGGGSVVHGLAMIATVKRAQANGQIVNTYNDGAAFSMAAILLQVGSTRYVADNSLTMLHAPHVDSGGDAKQLRKDAAALDRAENELVDIVAKRSGQPSTKVREWFSEESWFDAQETIAARLADQRFSDRYGAQNRVGEICAKYGVPARYRNKTRSPAYREVLATVSALTDARSARCRSDLVCAQARAVDAARKLTQSPDMTLDDLNFVSNRLKDIMNVADPT